MKCLSLFRVPEVGGGVFGSVVFPRGLLESCGSHGQREGDKDQLLRERVGGVGQRGGVSSFCLYYVDSFTNFFLSSEEMFTNQQLTWGCS